MPHDTIQILSDLVDTFLGKYSPGEPCPACGGGYIEDPACVLWCGHTGYCPLETAVILIHEQSTTETSNHVTEA